jgi:predicted RNA-binding Zn-ribbon protein involved in translation (DUF1610 family)
MAEGIRFECSVCGKTIQAWSDGNPYYINDAGRKKYAYHPDSKLDLCIGNDSPQICLACGKEFKSDSNDPSKNCPKCGSTEFVNQYDLNGKRCPYCKDGVFAEDPDFHCIS